MRMADGNLFVLLLLICFILLISGWFSFLYRDLTVSKLFIYCFCALLLLAASLSPITYYPRLWIHPAFILLTGIFFYMLLRLSREQQILLVSISVTCAVFLFMVHEMLLAYGHWNNFFFRFIVLLTVWSVSLYGMKEFQEQWICGWLILFLLHGIILVFYYERLSPIYIGAPDVLDTIGISLSGILVFRGLSTLIGKWYEKMRQALM